MSTDFDDSGPLESPRETPRQAQPRKHATSAFKPDVFVALLFISAAALCVAATFLVLEMGKYDWKMGP